MICSFYYCAFTSFWIVILFESVTFSDLIIIKFTSRISHFTTYDLCPDRDEILSTVSCDPIVDICNLLPYLWVIFYILRNETVQIKLNCPPWKIISASSSNNSEASRLSIVQDKQGPSTEGGRLITTGHCVLPQAVTDGQSTAILTDE